MPTPEDELNVLLSEKQHTDRAIGDSLELQLKIFALLSGSGAAVLGLFFATADKPTPSALGYAAALSAIGGCLVVLQSVATYGITVGYIHYKQVAIMPRLRLLSGMNAGSINTIAEFRNGPAALPVSFATAVLAVTHFIGTVCLLVFAQSRMTPASTRHWTLGLAIVILVATCVAEGFLLRAMNKAGMHHRSDA